MNTDRKKIVKGLKRKSLPSQKRTIQAITVLDPTDNKTLNGGGKFPVDWVKQTVADRLPANNQSKRHHHD